MNLVKVEKNMNNKYKIIIIKIIKEEKDIENIKNLVVERAGFYKKILNFFVLSADSQVSSTRGGRGRRSAIK